MNTHEILNLTAKEIDEWGQKNFPVRIPSIGIMEEIGEISHCVLKRYQGIRGFVDLTFFRANLLDAIADAGVYLLHSMRMKNIVLVNEIKAESGRTHDDVPDEQDSRDGIAYISVPAIRILEGYKNMPNGGCAHTEQVQRLSNFAASYKMDFTQAVVQTWQKVKQRDWVKNRDDAHLQISDVVIDDIQTNKEFKAKE